MLTKRIIPCLDVKNGRVVKGVNFLNLQDSGDPVELAAYYYKQGADEICFLDITASIEGRQAILDVISRTAKKVFIPLTVGGGVSKESDVGDLLCAGADKVAINSGAVRNPQLIDESARAYGTQCIVAALDCKRSVDTPSGWQIYVKGGRQKTGLDALEWSQEVVSRGAGEILLTSMDADGTREGYDLELTDAIAKIVNVPVIASGGAGSLDHIVQVLTKTEADSALIASLLHFGELTISQIKAVMKENNIPVRV